MTGLGDRSCTATGAVGRVPVLSARGSCAAASVVDARCDTTGQDQNMVTPPDIEAQILRCYHAEKWTVGTIARQLHVHHGVVRRVLAQAGLPRLGPPPRPSQIDAYLPFIRQTLENFPTLTASRLFAMAHERGYRGSPDHFRHLVGCHRPRPKAEAYLRLRCLLAHWPEAATQAWVEPLIGWEEQERARRSLERRLGTAHIGRFKPLCDFDWSWPKRCDRAAIEALMGLDFLGETTNVVLVGPNGVGKSTLAQNIAHQALIHGHTVLFTSAGQLLGDLCALDSDSALRRRLRHYARPQLLVIDEVGYLSYSNRHADLMFELVSRRYQSKSTLVTTNRGTVKANEH